MKKETVEEALIRLLKESGAEIVDCATKETQQKNKFKHLKKID